MKIRVTESHIERGRTCHSGLCPVALAFYDATGENWTVGSVNATRIRDGYRFQFPGWLVQWITDYDNGVPQTPIEFEVPAGAGVGA